MFAYIKHFIKTITAPVSVNEERRRSEFILHILLLAISGLSFSAFLINLVDWIKGSDLSVSVGVLFLIFVFFITLLIFSRRGYSLIVSFIFCGIFFTLNTYIVFIYGVDIPASLLTYALIVVMNGILMGTRFAFITTVVVVGGLFSIGFLQMYAIIPIESYWRSEIVKIPDLIFFAVLLSIIAVVSWLSNREIEKSLVRAKKSEAELKIERDNLEIKVEERTKEIKEMQIEKVAQLYRFAEFGKLSSGLFHDLVNPLTAASLNIEMVKNTDIRDVSSRAYVERALLATRKMEEFVVSVRKQLSKQEHVVSFVINHEIHEIVNILSYKARRARVTIIFEETDPIILYGDNIKWSQVALNLISNAIDAYPYDDDSLSNRQVRVMISVQNEMVLFTVTDYGVGIDTKNIPMVFEPFYTTKNSSDGLGIGLSLIKTIIEKDFKGSISVSSVLSKGSVFTVSIPHISQ